MIYLPDIIIIIIIIIIYESLPLGEISDYLMITKGSWCILEFNCLFVPSTDDTASILLTPDI